MHLLELHPRQTEAFLSPANEVLFGGASGGGKSHLIRVLFIVLCMAIPGLQLAIFRKYKRDIKSNHVDGPTGFKALLGPYIKSGFCEVVDGEVRFNHVLEDGTKAPSLISLLHCQNDNDLDKHQGVPRHGVAFDEAPQIRERYIRFIRGWVQIDESFKQWIAKCIDAIEDKELRANLEHFKHRFPLIFYTGNPLGESVGYFRRNFVKACEPFLPFTAPDSDGGHLRVYIPSKLTDNLSIDQEAKRKSIRGLGDDAMVQALELGDWDAPVGDFIRQWNDDLHRVRDFTPPEWWFKFRGFDWGHSDPFYVAWACVSDGEPFVDDYQRERWFPRGSIIIYREWNGCNPKDFSQGLEMSNVAIAQGIVDRTPEVTSNITITDSLPFQRRGAELMAETFMAEGVPLTQGNTARIVGWGRLKEYLTGKDGWPLFYVTDSCPFLCEYLPMLQRHESKPEDAQESGEATHSCDVARLIVMTRPPVKMKPVDNSALVEKPRVPIMTARGALRQIKRKKASGRY